MAHFDQIVQEVVEYLQPQKRFRGVEIEVPDGLNSAPFECDTTQIRQLLYNLFNNAADAVSECEERRISVDLDVSYEQETFTIAIADTAKGSIRSFSPGLPREVHNQGQRPRFRIGRL